MPSKYYDVVVIGRSLGALSAAALLARRDFTVLVIGHGRRPADYTAGEHTLRRRAFTMLAASSPVWSRLSRELAQTQTWRRRMVPVNPMLQVLGPRQRFEVPPDAARFAREVEREFSDVRRLVADLYADFARVTAAADGCFEEDAIWPPGTFFERRETMKVVSRLPYARAEPHADLLAEFPRDHTYRRIVAETVSFASELATPAPAFAVARLHAAWTRGLWALEGGEQELEAMLLDRIQANGGELLLQDRAMGREFRRGAVGGVARGGEGSAMGAGFVITDLTGEELALLSGGDGISKRAQREWPRITPTTGRFVTSIVVRRDGVPGPLGRESFLLPGDGREGLTGRAIHLQRARASGAEHELLVAEMLLSERDFLAIKEARAAILERIVAELPFIEQHLVCVDSPHDGLPVWCWEDTANGRVRREVDRVELVSSPRAEPMDRQLEVDPPGFLAVAGEPLRGPIDRTLLVGTSVLPGLGQEGQLLAAFSAARLVTRSDRRRARMRREMWTKMEIE